MVKVTDYAYEDTNTYSDVAESSPFAIQRQAPILRCLIDPLANLGTPDDEYFKLLQSMSTEDTGISIETLDLPTQPPAQNSAWRLAERSGTDCVFRRRTDTVTENPIVRGVYDGASTWFASKRRLPAADAEVRYLAHKLAMSHSNIRVFVTDVEPFSGYGNRRETMLCPPDAAMTLIGLYERLRGRVLLLERGVPTFYRPDWVAELACQVIIPEWRDTQRMLSAQPGYQEAAELIASSRLRFERVLHARDELMARSLMGSRYLPFAHSQELVERIAIGLVGMFDAAARAMNIRFKMGLDPQCCSFKRKEFRKALPWETRDAAVATRLVSVVSVLTALRNTIHHRHLETGWHSGSGDVTAHLSFVPADVSPDFLQDCAQLGIRSRLVQEFPEINLPGFPRGAAVRSAVVGEELLNLTVTSARAVMSATPWSEASVPEHDPKPWEHPKLLATLLRLYGFPED